MMKSLYILSIAILAASSSATAFDGDIDGESTIKKHDGTSIYVGNHCYGYCVGNYELDIDDDVVYLIPRSKGFNKVRITADHRLYVNHEEIELSDSQKELVGEFHGLAVGLNEDAKAIGYEGAKIGAAGAKLGLEALASVVKLLRSDYDSDDLEREIEFKASKIEAKAAKLEEKADKLEEKADRLKIIEEKLEREIPQLRETENS